VIIARYLVTQVFATLLGVVVVLLLIALSAQLVGLLGKVASGVLSVDLVMKVFSLKILTILVFILPLALFLAVLLALSRMYQDSEMAALAACGTGPGYIVRAIFGVALIFAVLQAVLTLLLAPWAEAQSQRLLQQAEASADIQGIVAGRFRELSQGVGVIYVQELSEDRTRMRNIFLQQQQGQERMLVTAESGYQFIDDNTGDRFMVLEQGFRYNGEPGRDNYAMIEFERHGIRIQEREPPRITPRFQAMPTKDLIKSKKRAHKTELQWRISSALMCLVLAVLAVPLSRSTPRQGRYARLALAIVVYMVFANMLSVARNWMYQGKLPPELGLWWVHGLMLVLAVILILRQTGYRHLFRRVKPA
jgi:lipopolysaccharide export system permease protein